MLYCQCLSTLPLQAVVFAFNVRNTVPEVLMERVSVSMSPSEPGAWRHIVTIAAPKVRRLFTVRPLLSAFEQGMYMYSII